MQSPALSTNNPPANSNSHRRVAQIISLWFLGISVLPPTGLLWQFGVLDVMGHWFVHHLLAALQLKGLVLS